MVKFQFPSQIQGFAWFEIDQFRLSNIFRHSVLVFVTYVSFLI